MNAPERALLCDSAPSRIVVRDAAGVVLLTQNAAPDRRPFIHPIVAPDGNGILTEDAPPHHPWQHGLYVGLNHVNGVGFWAEGLLRGKLGYDDDGTFHPRPMTHARQVGDTTQWEVVTDWRDKRGGDVLVETQHWTYAWHGASLATLDLAWTLTASVDITLGKSAYGGLFLRMPFTPDCGARALTSDGSVDQAGEGKPARWVAVEMSIAGRQHPASIAIFDHPKNPAHPTPFRIDGQFGVGPGRCIVGAWSLPRGQSATERYRLMIVTGDIDKNAIEAQWQKWSRESSS